MPTYSKHSKRHPQRPQASKDRRSNNQMAMNRKVTRDHYEANDIARGPINKSDAREVNQKGLDKLQSTMKPIRQSNRTFKNGGS